MRATVLLAAVLTLPACAQSEPGMVRLKAASDLRCDAESVIVQRVRHIDDENTDYRATACGRTAEYRCCWTTTTPSTPRSGTAPITRCLRLVSGAR